MHRMGGALRMTHNRSENQLPSSLIGVPNHSGAELGDRPPGWFVNSESKRSGDLFDGPPWPMGLNAGRSTVASRCLTLLVSLALVGLLLCSMALPWFTSAETPSWTPFSHWLNLGWSPGARNWAFLLLGLGAGVALGIGIALRSAGKFGIKLLFLLATGLLVVTLLEASAHLSVNPGPNLHADYGALIGSAAAALLWIGLALGPYLRIKR